MSSKIFIYTLLAAVVVMGGATILYRISPPRDPEVLTINNDGQISGEYKLQDIIALDESFKCEFKKSDSDSEVSGAIIIAPGAKVRGDFVINTKAAPAPFESHFIMRGGYIYTWTSLLKVGFIAPAVREFSRDQTSVIATNEKIFYNCARSMSAPGDFEVPADVTFSNASR
ncbi:MAG: hypothetical protein AAB863_01285 [Patescibacteria group bacterium]